MVFPQSAYNRMDTSEELEEEGGPIFSPNISSVSTESFYSTDSKSLPGSRNTARGLLTDAKNYIFQTEDDLKTQSDFSSKNRTKCGRKTKSQSLPPGVSLPKINLDETLTLERFHSMGEDELRETLENSFLENSLLQKELKMKDRAIFSLTECLKDMHSTSYKYQNRSIEGAPAQEQAANEDQSVGIVELESSDTDISLREPSNEMELFLVKSQDSTTTIFEEITAAFRDSRPVLEEKIANGSQFVAGGCLGSLGSYLLRKYGMTAMTALAGGILVIHVASKKGYIVVNWGEIYKKIEKKSEENIRIKSEGEWAQEQLENIKLWIVENKYFAAGFVAPFFYKIFK